jgi:hypothetical protein
VLRTAAAGAESGGKGKSMTHGVKYKLYQMRHTQPWAAEPISAPPPTYISLVILVYKKQTGDEGGWGSMKMTPCASRNAPELRALRPYWLRASCATDGVGPPRVVKCP